MMLKHKNARLSSLKIQKYLPIGQMIWKIGEGVEQCRIFILNLAITFNWC